MPFVDPTRSRKRNTGTAQLGGILASLNLNPNNNHDGDADQHNEVNNFKSSSQKQKQRQKQKQKPRVTATNAKTDLKFKQNLNIKQLKTPSAKSKLPTHLHVPMNASSIMMSPLASPMFTNYKHHSANKTNSNTKINTGTRKRSTKGWTKDYASAESTPTGTGSGSEVQASSNGTSSSESASATSASASASTSSGEVTSSYASSASVSASNNCTSNSTGTSTSTSTSTGTGTTPHSKSTHHHAHTIESQSQSIGSETLSEATEYITGVGLKPYRSRSSSSSSSSSSNSSSSNSNSNSNSNFSDEEYVDGEEYESEDENATGIIELYDNDDGDIDDDTYGDASYIVHEDYVPYGRALSGNGNGNGNGNDQDASMVCSDTDTNANSVIYCSSDSDIDSEKNSDDDDDDDDTSGTSSHNEGGGGYKVHDSPLAMKHHSRDDEESDEDNEKVQEAVVLNNDKVFMDSANNLVEVEVHIRCDSFRSNGTAQSSGTVKRSYSNMDTYASKASTASSSRNSSKIERRSPYTLSSSTSTSAIVRKGKWTLGTRIGEGSFGIVHTAMNGLTGKLMAVKTMNISSLSSKSCTLMDDLRREIEMMKALQHPNIVQYLGCETSRKKKLFHIFQEWLPGGSIASLLRKFGPFPLAVVRSYLNQILLGLAYLHESNILHRDIKGGNILVNDDGCVKLADFGTSRRIHVTGNGDAVSADDTMANMTMCGTPFFMAPEVFQENYGRKADIWSCACVAHQMCTGSHPWKGLNITGPIRLFSFITNNEGPPPVTTSCSSDGEDEEDAFQTPTYINESLQDILEQCFQRNPSNRPSSKRLLYHPFFSEADPDESTMEDESVQGFSVKGSRSVFSPISKDSPIVLKAIDGMMKVKKGVHKFDSNEWPVWAKNQSDDRKQNDRHNKNPYSK